MPAEPDPDPFFVRKPTNENSWRAVILFGRNVASYKFALGKSLLELAQRGQELVTLEELAKPFSHHVCQHLRDADKQGASQSSKFLDACRGFNRGEVDQDTLITTTARLGFENVIDAFHRVGKGDTPTRFFEDERRATQKGIRIRSEVNELLIGSHAENLPLEIEARWRLVETAWGLKVPISSIEVLYDANDEDLVIHSSGRRKSITSCRDALCGYQKGACFYCGNVISVTKGSDQLADVDHVIPHRLKDDLAPRNINGVWNLVLACKTCNRGRSGKSDALPTMKFAKRLHERNEHYVTSHHPLRETIINQTGRTASDRAKYLATTWNDAHDLRPGHVWEPEGDALPGT
jgi:5-methylcytosine-specific restriction endonuclease McrA